MDREATSLPPLASIYTIFDRWRRAAPATAHSLDAARPSRERPHYFFWYFQFRGFPSAIHSTAVAMRVRRVSSRLASVIHSMYSRL